MRTQALLLSGCYVGCGIAVLLASMPTATALASPDSILAPGSLLAPVSPSCITSPFGPRRRIGPNASGFHKGVDLAAPAGGVIRAVADGRVLAIHKRGPGGLEILIGHGKPGAGGFESLYSHIGLVAPAFAEGKRQVKAGEKIGVVGRTGVTYGTHLYFGILANGVAIDPEPFLPVTRCGKP